jgi:hypothetical protein
VALPPELRRKLLGPARVAPRDVGAADRVALALQKAQQKLSQSLAKSKSSITAARGKLLSRV